MRRVDAWLSAARDAIARESGLDPALLELDAETTETILALARVAAHESGDRTNAPLLSYLVGLARRSGTDLPTLTDAVGRSSS
jgi:hypothetical protein